MKKYFIVAESSMDILSNSNLDSVTAMKLEKCFFKPWVGADYHRGYNGIKTLVLGESHYGDSSYGPELHTIDCTIEYGINGKCPDGKPPQKFYAGVHYAIGIDHSNTAARTEFWSCVAFNNYVQCFLADASTRPTSAEWATGREPFKELITELAPDLILVFGHTVWTKMPAMGHELPSLTGVALKEPVEAYRYEYYGGKALAIKLHHPSRNFDREYARAAVSAALSHLSHF